MTKSQSADLVPDNVRRSISRPDPSANRWLKLTPMEAEFNALSLLRMVKRRKWTLILTVLTLPILTYIALQQAVPLYTASGTVIVESSNGCFS